MRIKRIARPAKRALCHAIHSLVSSITVDRGGEHLPLVTFPVENKTTSNRGPTIPVVMCMWKRIENLPSIISCLNQQNEVNVELYLWNNNTEYQNLFEDLIKKSNPNFPVFVYNSKKNTGGFGRFFLGKKICQRSPFMVTIDDDQMLSPDFLKVITAEFTQHHIHSAWSFNFEKGKNYWQKTATPPGKDADYCGTGGAIFDTAIFNDDEVFHCPKRYWFIEDLWISYIAKKKGWSLKKSHAKMQLLEDGKDQHSGIYELKNTFLSYLRKAGGNIY